MREIRGQINPAIRLMTEVYLLLGGNIGDSQNIFQQTIYLISNEIGPITKKSSIYRSPAWGFACENDFFNQVICVTAKCKPDELIQICMQIEMKLGRTREPQSTGYTSRIIDIDVLLYGTSIINSASLTVPHPRMHLRRFTLLPLAEIAWNVLHPLENCTIDQLLHNCPDQSVVLQL